MNVWLLATMALAIVASVAVCVMGAMLWKYDRAGPWAWLSVLFAGGSMVGTWLLITLESIPDADIYRAPQQAEQADTPRKLERLPPDDFYALTMPGPIAWPKGVKLTSIYWAIAAAKANRYVSTRTMQDYGGLTQIEAGIFRDWLHTLGAGEIDGRGALVVSDDGWEILDRLSPSAKEHAGAKPRIKQSQSKQYGRYSQRKG
ncbi:MAG: hypothetical protein WC710_14105 [Gallionella sp.]